MARKSAKALQRNVRGGGIVRLEMDSAGAKELLRSEASGDLVERAAHELLLPIVRGMSPRGAEWRVNRFRGKDRQRVHVATGNREARAAEAKSRTLTRAIGMITTGRKPR